MKKKNVFLSLLGITVFFGAILVGADTALAANRSPLAKLSPLAFDSYLSFKGLCYGVAGISTLGAGAVAMGSGRMPTKWLVALVLSLTMASGSGEFVNYITGADL
ncbi:MAG: hypothetical protein ACK5O9_03600 [Holosporales bacterium]|jgi:hypothetical protein